MDNLGHVAWPLTHKKKESVEGKYALVSIIF